MPTLAEAVTEGTLSFDKAVVVARSADEASEGALVDLATRATVAQTQRLCSAWRRQRATDPHLGGVAPQGASDGGGQGDAATVVVTRDAHGVELRARFDHVDGAVVLASLEACTAAMRAERAQAAPVDPSVERDARSISAEVHEDAREERTLEQWRGLGLLRLAEASRGAVPEAPQRNGFDTQVVLHVGVDTLVHPPGRTVNHAPVTARPPVNAPNVPGEVHTTSSDRLEAAEVLDRLAVGGPQGAGSSSRRAPISAETSRGSWPATPGCSPCSRTTPAILSTSAPPPAR